MRIFVAAAAAVLAGCSAQPRQDPVVNEAVSQDRALAEAIALTAEAQRAHDAGDEERAIELYRRAVQASPDAPADAWNNLGVLLMERGEYVESVSAFRTAAELRPTDARPPYNIGVVYHKAGHEQRAVEAFQESLRRDRHYLPAMRGLLGSANRLRLADEDIIEVYERALLIETDQKYRDLFMRERLEMKARLDAAGQARSR